MRYLIIILVVLLTSSCKKEGCTDDLATNFDTKAKKDDGSCEFEGKVMFWTDCADCCQIAVKVDDKFIGNTTFSYNSEPVAPNCIATGCVTTTLPVGSYSWSGTETCLNILVGGSFTITENGCTVVPM